MTELDIDHVPVGPRERLLRVGVGKLSDDELVALVLGTGRAQEPVLALSTRVLRECRGLRGLSRLGAGALMQIEGLGVTKAARLIAAMELGRRMIEAPWTPGTRIETSRDVRALARAAMVDAEVESFVALALDAKNRLVSQIEIAKGGLSFCPVSPGDAFRALLREGAASAIFVHNHPSGDLEPSPDDIALTHALVAAGELLGVPVHDHVIIAKTGHLSFLDAGLMAQISRRTS